GVEPAFLERSADRRRGESGVVGLDLHPAEAGNERMRGASSQLTAGLFEMLGVVGGHSVDATVVGQELVPELLGREPAVQGLSPVGRGMVLVGDLEQHGPAFFPTLVEGVADRAEIEGALEVGMMDL